MELQGKRGEYLNRKKTISDAIEEKLNRMYQAHGTENGVSGQGMKAMVRVHVEENGYSP